MLYIAIRCGEESFQCSNNKCVPISSYCDGIDDCGDTTDEPELCRNYTAKISSTAKSESLHSKILNALIIQTVNSVLQGTTLDNFITKIVIDILEAPALNNFVERIIAKIMGWLILVIIVIVIIFGTPVLLLIIVCALKPGCMIYKWRHHQQPRAPSDCENSIERRQRQYRHEDTSDGKW